MHALAQITFEPVHDPAGRIMDELLAIYEEAIPARERKTATEVRATALSPRPHLEVARDRDHVAPSC